MSERPVEEILGWTFCATTDYGRGWIKPDGKETIRAEADDMLAWLWSRGFDVFFGSNRTHLSGESLPFRSPVKVTLKPYKAHAIYFARPTLHGALEAAVRAVGTEVNP